MSFPGPIISDIAYAYLRVNRSFSSAESLFGSQMIPPLPPPKGTLTIAHFHVIHIESAFTSSIVTSG